MSIEDLYASLSIIDEGQNEAYFSGEKSIEVISLAESALGVKFPPTYFQFLKLLGSGDIGGNEFYGIIDSDFENSGVPDAVWITKDLQKIANLPSQLIIIYAIGDGSYYALDSSDMDVNGEYPVIFWEPGIDVAGKKYERVADDFGRFMLNILKNI